MPPAHDEPQPEPLPDNEDNSENSEDAAKKRSLLGRMWSKVAMGVHLDIHSDHAVAGQPSFIAPLEKFMPPGQVICSVQLAALLGVARRVRGPSLKPTHTWEQ
ncbi:hypothetical protein N2152v2_003377 [Parachlorella kessleri]